MALGAGNSMDVFNAGVMGGQVRSPAYAIGNQIKGTLDQARKMGLIQEQSRGNIASAVASAGAKQRMETDYGNQMIETPLYGPKGNLIANIPHKRAIDPIVQKPVSAEEQLMGLYLDDELRARDEQDTPVQNNTDNKNLAPKKVINGKTYQKVEGGWQLIK